MERFSAFDEKYRNILMEKANTEKLTGVFGDAAWTNKNRLPDRLLKDILEVLKTI